jgi:1,4-alpha-glucan branching enzyme
MSDSPGELAIVLHTHMPYVEGFGTWPFGEEWLWEAIATSYLPVLKVLDDLGPDESRRRITLSLTPVLADQLEAPGAIERCITFLREIRPESHRRDIEGLTQANDTAAASELQRSADEYAQAADTLASLTRHTSLLQKLGEHATWTSSASHAILPLLALDDGIDLQLRVGIESHRARFEDWQGGFWLPECAYAPRLNGQLTDHGVKAACVEYTSLLGPGGPGHLTPRQHQGGPTLYPVDRQTIDLIWGARGYPSRPAYRDYHRLTTHHHHLHANDGSLYDPVRAADQAEQDAREFIEAVKRRTSSGGLCVCAIDTELLGHWWYEGPIWLKHVLEQADGASLRLTALTDDVLERHPPQPDESPTPATTSWGADNDLSTWSGPAVADMIWQARTAELNTFRASPSPRALRELMALQSSDWAFMVSRGWAGDYPKQRASGHAAQLQRALAGELDDDRLRNLAPRFG